MGFQFRFTSKELHMKIQRIVKYLAIACAASGLVLSLLPTPVSAAPQEMPLRDQTFYWSENTYDSTGSVRVWDSTGWLISSVTVQINSCASLGLTAVNAWQNDIQ